jgi:hypothetical protein
MATAALSNNESMSNEEASIAADGWRDASGAVRGCPPRVRMRR